MSEIVFFLEERSAKELLQGLLPRILHGESQDVKFTYKVYSGKSDLQDNLAKDLKHYNVPN